MSEKFDKSLDTLSVVAVGGALWQLAALTLALALALTLTLTMRIALQRRCNFAHT